MKKILVGLGIVLLAVVAVTLFQSWRDTVATRAALDAESRVIETARGPMEFREVGSSDRVLLVIHGTPGGHDQAAGIGELASIAGWRVVAPSRPGYLRTPLATGRTSEEQADAYAALLDALDIRRAAILGISGGGPSALEFAARHPDRCRALIHMMGVSRPDSLEERRERGEGDRNGGEAGLLQRFQRTNLGGWLMSGAALRDPAALVPVLIPDPANQQRILESPDRLANFSQVIRSVLTLPGDRTLGAANDLEQFASMSVADLESIRAPTLVVHGTADTSVPLAMGELVANRVPGARLFAIEGGDHFIPMTHDVEVFGEVFGFLNGLSDSRP